MGLAVRKGDPRLLANPHLIDIQFINLHRDTQGIRLDQGGQGGGRRRVVTGLERALQHRAVHGRRHGVVRPLGLQLGQVDLRRFYREALVTALVRLAFSKVITV